MTTTPLFAPVERAVALRTRDGNTVPVDAHRWVLAATPADRRVLARARGPVLDVGCGPGRHVSWLHHVGTPVLGIDVSPRAVAAAQARGARVRLGCVFDAVPFAGYWRTVLLLDGNIGIAGDPIALLRRCRSLLRRDGTILTELGATGAPARRIEVRLELDGVAGPWFEFATVPASQLDELAHGAGYRVVRRWGDAGRVFAQLAPHTD